MGKSEFTAEMRVTAPDFKGSGDLRACPGPNSNSFTAWVIRQVEGLEAVLPVTAVGKEYLFDGLLATAPGGRGVTASLGGVLGLTLGRDEGIELTLLGLSLGVDLRRPALKLPGVGRLGMAPVIKGQVERSVTVKASPPRSPR